MKLKIGVITILVIIGLFGSHLTIGQAVNTKKLSKAADKAWREKKYEEAFPLYVDLTKINPKDSTNFYYAGKCALLSVFPTKAEPYFEKAVLSMKKPPAEWIFDYARSLHINYKFDKAIKQYELADPEHTIRGTIARYISECINGKNYLANPVQAKIFNLGKGVNSSNHEYLPQITADLRHLYFTSRRKGTTGGGNAADGLPYEDIYVAQNSGGVFSGVVQLPEPINSRDNDASIGLSADGQTLFIYKGRNGGDIYISKFDGKHWSRPLQFEYNTEFLETSASVSPDGKSLFFVSDRAGGKDIYICRRSISGRSWMSPQRMNGNINTLEDEESPQMHADGKTIYFSSRGHKSMGGYDIYRCELNTKGVYSNPVNLGYPINTTLDDLYFSLSADGRTGFFSSERPEGMGGQDIYTIAMPPMAAPSLALLKGVVKDEATGSPTLATITITDNEANEKISVSETDASDGTFAIPLPSGKNYGITIEKDGRLFYSDNINFPEGAGFQEIKRDVILNTVKVGGRIVLNNLFFDTDKSELRPASLPELALMVKTMQQFPKIKIEISGHTDNTGSEEINKKLSQSRADAVKTFLQEKGVASTRVTAIGYSSSKPLSDNKTEKGKQLNRRTELKIINN